MTRIALITGATSGIGRATALALAKAGYNTLLVGRRTDRLLQLAQSLPTPSHALTLDVRDAAATESAFAALPAEFSTIDVLINNAGLAAGLDPIHRADRADWDQMIDTNIKGLLNVTRMVVPGMVNRKRGHIINLSSIAGREAYGQGAVYCATKHAVEALTQSMRIDLVPHGIKVGQVSPGLVETEFSLVRFKGDDQKAALPYRGMQPLTAEDVASVITWMVTAPPHVNIADVLVLPTAQATATQVHREP
jgi:NADP-dependent 3-hydroxy acid dehydrogenase YdfG